MSFQAMISLDGHHEHNFLEGDNKVHFGIHDNVFKALMLLSWL